ncbi:hypothetical protein [Roseiarcus sp.]|uniref:hypothetical protein n=1 Tax=Roseiarcus sp. TaxID=1969460 RepID=UPI003F97E8EF
MRGEAITQQFARVATESGVIPGILNGGEHLDLRPVAPDICPDVIASGALTTVDTAGFVPPHGATSLYVGGHA